MNQTNFSSNYFFALIANIKRYFFTTFNITLIIFIVAGCSSNSPIKKTINTAEKLTITKIESVTKTAEQKLALAQLLLTTSTTPLEKEQAILLLVEASELFLQEKHYSKALWLANKTLPLTFEIMSKTKELFNYRLLLVKAISLQALNYNDLALTQLQLAEKISLSHHINLTDNYYLLLSDLYQSKAQPIAALNADLNAFYLNNDTDEQDVIILWQKLQLLSQWQLTQLARQQPPFIAGWQQLLNYSHKFGHNQAQFNRYLSQWQRRYPTHPAILLIQQLRQTSLTQKSIENIAVILPLSGRQKSAGLVAQQGVLAAYNNNKSKKLHFFDSNQVNWHNLSNTLTEQDIDYVIGPLLKANVEAYVMQNTVSPIPVDINKIGMEENKPQRIIPTLLLNLPKITTLPIQISALSMRREDEASQAATTLSQNNYHHPIILSHQDKVSKRIASAFAKQWQVITGAQVDIVYFEKGKQMQANLKASLDVSASQVRINSIKARLKQTIKAESRNRRDIDMIYIVGSAEQTRLVKPYIDVNTSPFAKVIPVYASSRSHSRNKSINNNNDANADLQGLTFTEIPWLLNSNQQNKALVQLTTQLWPKRSDSLSRIFAMGFDSYNLIHKIPLMQQASYIRHFGQTGVLKLNDNNILTRSLLWGRYQNDKVLQIVMD